MDQLVSLGGAPASVYNGSREGGRPARRGAPGGVLLPLGVGLPPFLVGIGFVEEGGKEEREEEGGPAPSPCPIQTKGGGQGRVAHLWPPLLSSTKAH